MPRAKHLACPAVSRSGGRSKSASTFNEGIEVPQAHWDAITKRKPELVSRDRETKTRAIKKEILTGELAKYRRR